MSADYSFNKIVKMTPLDELFAQIGKFVLKQPDFVFMRAQTIVKQHTEKLAQIGDLAFPITAQPWLNAIDASPDHKNDFKHIFNESETEFAEQLYELSQEWIFPVSRCEFNQFRCLLFLNRQKCYSNLLKTVLYDETASYDANSGDSKYAIRLVKQSNDTCLVEYRLQLIAKVLNNLLRNSRCDMNTAKANVNSIENKSLTDVLVKSARRDGGKRAIRQSDDIELNNNANRKTISIICGNVVSKQGLTADDIIR